MSESEGEMVTGEKTILLAEDDPSHEALFRRAMSDGGFTCQIDVVRDGTEAINYLFATGEYADRDPQELPALILLDLRMPKMSGLQVLQVLRRVRGEDSLRFPPVVVLTSSSMDNDVAEAYRLGAQSYICKPTDYRTFASAVCETLHYWLDLNHPVPIRRIGEHLIHEAL